MSERCAHCLEVEVAASKRELELREEYDALISALNEQLKKSTALTSTAVQEAKKLADANADLIGRYEWAQSELKRHRGSCAFVVAAALAVAAVLLVVVLA